MPNDRDGPAMCEILTFNTMKQIHFLRKKYMQVFETTLVRKNYAIGILYSENYGLSFYVHSTSNLDVETNQSQ